MSSAVVNVLSAPISHKILENGFIEISELYSPTKYYVYDDNMMDVMLGRIPKESRSVIGYIKSANETLEVLKSSATKYLAVMQHEIFGIVFNQIFQSHVPLYAYQAYYNPMTTPAQKEIISFCVRALKENQKAYLKLKDNFCVIHGDGEMILVPESVFPSYVPTSKGNTVYFAVLCFANAKPEDCFGYSSGNNITHSTTYSSSNLIGKSNVLRAVVDTHTEGIGFISSSSSGKRDF